LQDKDDGRLFLPDNETAKEKRMSKQALIFDLDGTLWDAIAPIQNAWNEAMIAAKESFRFDYAKTKSYMGLTPEETCPLAFPGLPFEKQMALFHQCIASEIAYLAKHPGTLYPHEKEVLALLGKTYPLYIVSNSDKGYVENYLRACQMEAYFQGHLCAGDTGLAKWGSIQQIMAQEGITSAIYIGDTLKDKIESEKAGVAFIHAAYGFGKIEPEGYAISSLEELPNLASVIFKELSRCN
jgi:phosphoglycolate phosphatase